MSLTLKQFTGVGGNGLGLILVWSQTLRYNIYSLSALFHDRMASLKKPLPMLLESGMQGLQTKAKYKSTFRFSWSRQIPSIHLSGKSCIFTYIFFLQVVPENREEIETNIRTALGTVCDPDDVEVDLKNAVSNLDLGFQVQIFSKMLVVVSNKHLLISYFTNKLKITKRRSPGWW